MFGIPYLLQTDGERAMIARWQQAEIEHIQAVPADWPVPFGKRMHISSAKFQAAVTKDFAGLFPVKPHDGPVRDMPKAVAAGEAVLSPDGNWAFTDLEIPPGRTISVCKGSQRGQAVFDAPCPNPALFGKRSFGWTCPADGNIALPWMSLTPMEVITLDCGTRFAKGRCIVAGLGLGYQLLQVCRRKQVKEVVLVEQSRSLVDWLLPVLQARHPELAKVCTVVIEDFHAVAKELEADSCLVDIHPGYGGNTENLSWMLRNKGYSLQELEKRCGKPWVWGSQYVKGS